METYRSQSFQNFKPTLRRDGTRSPIVASGRPRRHMSLPMNTGSPPMASNESISTQAPDGTTQS